MARLVMTPTTSAARGRCVAVEDDRRARIVALEARQHEAQQVDVAADDRPLLDEVVHQAGRDCSRFRAKGRNAAGSADNSALLLDDDGAQIVHVLPAHAFASASIPLSRE